MRRVALAVALFACGNGKPPAPASAPPPSGAASSGAAPTSTAGTVREDLLARPVKGLPKHALRRLGTEAFRHPSGFGLQATPDGSRLLSLDQSSTLRTWDVATGALLGEIDTFVGGLLLPDGKRVITEKGVQSITGERLATKPVGTQPLGGTKLVVVIDRPKVVVLDATTLAEVGTFEVSGEIDRAAVAPDDSALAIASGSIVTTYKLPAGGTGRVVRFDGDLSELAFVGPTRIAGSPELDRVVVHDLAKDTRILDWKATGEVAIVTDIAGMRDGKRMVVTMNGIDCQLIDVDAKRATPLATSPSVGIDAAELGTTGIVAVQTTDSIRMFDLATGKAVRVPEGHQETVTGLVFAGGALLSGSDDGSVLRWNVVEGMPAARAPIERGVDAMALSYDGKRLAVAGEGGGVLDATTLAELDARGGVNDVAWRGDKAVNVGLMGTLSMGSAYIDGTECGTVCQLAVTAKGEVAVGDANGEKLVIALSFDEVAKAPRIDVCGYLRALDRTSTRVAFAGDSCGELRDANGTLVLAFERQEKGEYTIRSMRLTSVAFSADGTHLATGWEDGLVEIRDSATGSVVKSFTGHRDDISALAFDATGGLLASGSTDGTIVVWNAW